MYVMLLRITSVFMYVCAYTNEYKDKLLFLHKYIFYERVGGDSTHNYTAAQHIHTRMRVRIIIYILLP